MSRRPQLELPSHEILSKLARDDPQTFESFRRELVDTFIESAPERLKPRLSGIQFRVDHERRLSRSALGATVRIYELMWKSFLRLNHEWQDTVRLKDGLFDSGASTSNGTDAPRRSAQVLGFRPRPLRDEK
jgi:hypothetical protein